MSKIFYTERDIDDLKARGVDSIDVSDNVVMTDLAVERAFRHGIRIKRAEPSSPRADYSPSANSNAANPTESLADSGLKQKIKSAVLRRLDGQVEDALLDAVITRILAEMK